VTHHPEGYVLNYKKAAEMKKHYHLTRRHFSRGINHILVEMIENSKKRRVTSYAGEDDAEYY
jgi:hypothetical protein